METRSLLPCNVKGRLLVSGLGAFNQVDPGPPNVRVSVLYGRGKESTPFDV